MDKTTKISIVVPVYNLQKELSRCITSILKQTYSNLEILIVNDGSTDNSKEVIEQLAQRDKRIVAIHKKNGGVTSARLEGVKKAKGEYIGFVDGDDEIEADMYDFLLSNALQYKADISHCGYQMIFDDGRVHYFYNTGYIVEENNLTGIKDLWEGKRIEPGLCNKLFHKNLFRRLLRENLMDCSIKINEDLLMNYYLFSVAKKSIFVDVCKYHYIVRETSASRQKLNRNKIYDPIRVKQTILADCKKEIKNDAKKALLNTCIHSYCSLILDKDPREQEKKEIRSLVVKYYDCVILLSKRTRILAKLIVKSPNFLSVVYPLYSKFFQKKKYV